MALKMKELVEITNENKSTILYYIKEGLLPQPQKIKANLHLYDEICIDIIKFIKYLQKNYHYSISEIKDIFKNLNFSKSNSFYLMIQALKLINYSKEFLSKEEFLREAKITQEELDEFLKKEYIYKYQDGFSKKDLEIIKIIKELINLNMQNLIDNYVKSAKEIAQIEIKLWSELFKRKDTIKEYQLAFDTILKLKPYIYNMQTLNEYHNAKDRK